MGIEDIAKYLKNIQEVKPLEDTCGQIRELYHSDNMSVAHVTIKTFAFSHQHRKMEEVYYILSGNGLLYIGEEKFKVLPGDTITIPKNTYHHLENVAFRPLELLVITHPRYDTSDVILEPRLY